MPRLTALRFANPNGIQIHQPRVGGPSRTGEERLPWVTFPKMFSTLNGLVLAHGHRSAARINRELRELREMKNPNSRSRIWRISRFTLRPDTNRGLARARFIGLAAFAFGKSFSPLPKWLKSQTAQVRVVFILPAHLA